MGDLEILLYISSKLEEGILSTTTSVMATDLDTSQQTISRKLRDCEDAGLIQRSVTPSGMRLQLTEKALDILKKHHAVLTNLFSNTTQSVSGVLQSGLGEGRYYMAIEGYQKQFRDKLGFIPFLGTLNLAVNSHAVDMILQGNSKKIIDGFETSERTYGGIDCYRVSVEVKGKNVNAIVIVPHRTTHEKNVIELIAPFSFREKFGLEDGDELVMVK
jgi:riboflavin kinase, archaea type